MSTQTGHSYAFSLIFKSRKFETKRLKDKESPAK